MKIFFKLILLVIASVSLGACDLIETENPIVQQSPEDDCDADQVLVDNVCTNEDDDPDSISTLDGPNYQSQGYADYEGRNLVTNDCSYLDNIGEWQPVWCDEFNEDGLPDSSKWSYDVGGHGWGNNELQYYTDADIDNAYIQNGYLTIEAMKEEIAGNDYTSARLVSKYQGDWTYGKIQVRAQVPAGKGTWPAIWMLPTDWEYGGWPDSGEIDIMEYVGVDPGLLHGSIHTAAFNHMIGTQKSDSIEIDTMETEFHVYEIEWEPNVIRYYVNGQEYYSVNYNPSEALTSEPWQAWPFDKDFHLILNLAFGGNWGGYAGVDGSLDHMKFGIDYVRVYQKDYQGMDNDAPSAVTNLQVLSAVETKSLIGWDVASDDVMVEYYEVYVDDVLNTTTTHNGAMITAKTETVSVDVIPVDFAGNKGPKETVSLDPYTPPTQVDRIEAEHYIQMDGVQIESTSDVGGGLNVGYIDYGDYIDYVVEVTEAGTYQLKARVASLSEGGSFDIYQDDVWLADCTFDATGDWQNWQDAYSSQFSLDTGTYTFRVEAKSAGWNINYFEFIINNGS